MNYLLVSHFACMYCMNSAHNNYNYLRELIFTLLKGSQN